MRAKAPQASSSKTTPFTTGHVFFFFFFFFFCVLSRNTQPHVGKLHQGMPEFARKLDDSVTNLDSLLKGINEGKGTAGQLIQNRALYDHLDQTADQAQQLIKGMRENPKKYLVIQLRLF